MIHFVTVATKSSGYFDVLMQSCVRHGIDLHVLGWNEKWGGWVWRLDLILDHYRQIASYDPDAIICFVDAYDVVFLQSAFEIESRFLSFNQPIVVAEDHNMNPLSEIYAKIFLFGMCRSRRVNAGTYMGYAKDLVELLTELKALSSSISTDDQRLLTLVCQNNATRSNHISQRIAIDTDRSIFLCMRYKNGPYMAGIKIDEKDRALYYSSSNIRPCILHGAGNADLDSTILMLGYVGSHTSYRHVRHIRRLINNNKIATLILLILILILIYIFISCQTKFRTHYSLKNR